MYSLGKTEDIKSAYKCVLNENTYGNSLTNKDAWLETFDKIGKEVDETKEFEATGKTFGAITDAENWVQSMDYSVGSMQSDNPIALAKGNLNIAKWWNINPDEYHRIDGMILSDDYRDGKVEVILFKDKSDLGEEEKPEDEETTTNNEPQEEPEIDLNTEEPSSQGEEELDFSNIQLPESKFEKDLKEYEKLFENENSLTELSRLVDAEYEALQDYSLEDFTAYARDAIENLSDQEIAEVYYAYIGDSEDREF